MFENETKGMHGCYSNIGKVSAEKYRLIIRKDEILSDKHKKKKFNSFLSVLEPAEKKHKTQNKNEKSNVEIDIFTMPPTNDKLIKEREEKNLKKFICKFDNEKNVPEKYKYHQHHHKELHNYNLLAKNQQQGKISHLSPGTGIISNSKMEVIWSRVLSGPKWKIVSGREKKPIKRIKESKKNTNLYSETYSNNDSHSKNKHKKDSNVTEGNNTQNDYRPKTMTNFFSLKKNNNKFNKNIILRPLRKIMSRIIVHSSTNLYHSKSTKNFNAKKKNFYVINKKKNDIKHTINFAKTLSRNKNLFLINKDDEEVRPFFTPNYNYVEPRCITMVSYSQKNKRKNIYNRIQGMEKNILFDPDKVIYKYNNHILAKPPDFNIMSGRKISNTSPLPSFMMNIPDRAALEILNEKGLKMNNYANGSYKNNFSSFFPKKSFNKLINYNYINNDKSVCSYLEELYKVKNISPKLGKLIKFYSKDLEYYQRIGDFENKIDAITLKTLSPKDRIRIHKKHSIFGI